MEDGDVELVKMSEKGQLVVPQGIRESLNLNPGERFIAVPMEDAVLFKKVDVSSIREEFEKISKETQKKFVKNKVSRKDVREAVGWARKS